MKRSLPTFSAQNFFHELYREVAYIVGAIHACARVESAIDGIPGVDIRLCLISSRLHATVSMLLGTGFNSFVCKDCKLDDNRESKTNQ